MKLPTELIERFAADDGAGSGWIHFHLKDPQPAISQPRSAMRDQNRARLLKAEMKLPGAGNRGGGDTQVSGRRALLKGSRAEATEKERSARRQVGRE